MNKRLVVFGLGLYSELALHYFGSEPGWQVEAFTVDADYARESTFCGLPVLAWEEAVQAFPAATHEMFVGIGYSKVNGLRRDKYRQVKAAGYRLPRYVHPSAVVSANARLGDNCLVREQALVGPFASVGDNVFIGAKACVSHHTVVEDHCYLAPAAVVCGSVRLGEGCFVGANSTLRDGLTLGPGCVIGAGAVVLSDCPPGAICRAEPARCSARAASRLARI